MTPKIPSRLVFRWQRKVTATVEALHFWRLGTAIELLSKDYGIIQVLVTCGKLVRRFRPMG